MNLLTILPKLEKEEIGMIGWCYEWYNGPVAATKQVSYWVKNPMQVGLLEAHEALSCLLRWNQMENEDLVAKLRTLIYQAHLQLDKTGEP